MILTGNLDEDLQQKSYSPTDLQLGPDGYPVLLYDYYEGDLYPEFFTTHTGLVVCNDPACTGDDETITVFDGLFRPNRIVEIRPDGRPLLQGTRSDDGRSYLIGSCQDRYCDQVDVAPIVAEDENLTNPNNPV